MLKKGKGFADQPRVFWGRKNAGRCFGEEKELDDKTQNAVEGDGMKKGFCLEIRGAARTSVRDRTADSILVNRNEGFPNETGSSLPSSKAFPLACHQHEVWEGMLGDVTV